MLPLKLTSGRVRLLRTTEHRGEAIRPATPDTIIITDSASPAITTGIAKKGAGLAGFIRNSIRKPINIRTILPYPHRRVADGHARILIEHESCHFAKYNI